jgi:hypothetical protein
MLIELLLSFVSLSQMLTGGFKNLFLHLIVNFPPSQLAYITHNVVLFLRAIMLLRFFNT